MGSLLWVGVLVAHMHEWPGFLSLSNRIEKEQALHRLSEVHESFESAKRDSTALLTQLKTSQDQLAGVCEGVGGWL